MDWRISCYLITLLSYFIQNFSLVNVLIPLIVILFAFKHKGKVGIDSRKWDNTPIPKIDSALLFPSFAIALRATLYFKIIGFTRLILFAIIISIPFIIMLFLGTKEYLVGKKIFTGMVLAILFIFTFGCGTTVFWNAFFENSTPTIYKSKIIGKKIEKGKTISYRIDFEPWDPIKENDLMRVSKSEFNRLNINYTIDLELKQGLLKNNVTQSWLPTIIPFKMKILDEVRRW